MIRQLARINYYSVLKKKKRFGHCSICSRATLFVHVNDWAREGYRCIRCGSPARGRALFYVLNRYIPEWRGKRILEAAPHGSVSKKLKRECSNYVGTTFRSEHPLGKQINGLQNEDLRALSYPDEYFDIVITQDVLEHVFEPERAFREISRVLKVTGIHIFTVPFHRGALTSVRARLANGQIEYVREPVFHRDPASSSGTLVVTDWGDDIDDLIAEISNMSVNIEAPALPRFGIEGPSLEVFVATKVDSRSQPFGLHRE